MWDLARMYGFTLEELAAFMKRMFAQVQRESKQEEG
jgi:hypothetical protein